MRPAKIIKMKVALSDAAKPYASMIMNRVHLVIKEHHDNRKLGGPIKGNSMAGLLVKISNQRSSACFPLLLDPGLNDEHFNGTFNWTWDTIMPLYETYKRGEVTWVEQLPTLAKFMETSDRTKMTIYIWKRENTKLRKGEREDTGILKTVSGTSKPVTALLHAILMKNANIGRVELYTSQDSTADKVDFRANFEETVSWDKKGHKQEYLYTKKNPKIIHLVMTLQAGGTGITLIRTRLMFVMEPQYDEVTVVQFIGRARRIGQEAKVEVYLYENKDELDFEYKISNTARIKSSLMGELAEAKSLKKRRVVIEIDDD